MTTDRAENIKELLTWHDQYSCPIALVDTQHQGILSFINDWYQQVISAKGKFPDLAEFMAERLAFLDRYSKSHLRFEEELLSILVKEHGFPAGEYQGHMSIHKRFVNEFMGNVTAQLQMLNQRMNKELIDNLAGDALSDLARWWYGHIRGGADGLPAGPDYVYRCFLQDMPKEKLVALLNQLLHCTCKFSQ